MSPTITEHGVVFATAMAVSGTVILLALRLQRSPPQTQFPVHEISPSPPPILRSCISSDLKKRQKKKMKKRVHFAEDVMDSCGDGAEFRRRVLNSHNSLKSNNSELKVQKNRGMPENRVALYNGILRDRVSQRLAYSC